MTDEERRKAIFGDGSSSEQSTTTTAPTDTTTSSQTDDQRRSAIFGGSNQATGGQQYQPPSLVEPSDALEAFQAGTLSGIGDVAGGIQRIFGFNPTLSTATQNKLTEQQTQGMAVHPWAAGFGRMFGQTAGTLPATLATAYAFPEVAGAPLVARLVPPLARAAPIISRGFQSLPLWLRGAFTGGVTGGENALLTSGQNPEEPLWSRGLHGAGWGALTGIPGGWLEGYAGANQTLSPDVQAAGRRAQAAGVDVMPGNLPRAAGPANTRGAAPTIPQAGQINQGFGNIIGENTPNFAPGTLDPLMKKLGSDVGNAVQGGNIALDVPLTTAATPTSKTFAQRLAEIEADNPGVPMVKKIISSSQGILSKVNPVTGQISGSDVGTILDHNGWLQRLARSPTEPGYKAANEIEEAVQDAFRQSSTPGQAEAYRLARERYKIGLTAEQATDNVTGNLDPGRLMTAAQSMYDDSKRLGAGSSATDQAVQYARDTARLYGGKESVSPAAPHAGWIPSVLGAASGAGLQGAMHFLPAALPAAVSNPLIAAGAAVVPLGYKMLANALAHYQNTGMFANDLMRRGSQRAMPGIAGTAGSAGASASEQPWF